VDSDDSLRETADNRGQPRVNCKKKKRTVR
jgi:hypothetical protein